MGGEQNQPLPEEAVISVPTRPKWSWKRVEMPNGRRRILLLDELRGFCVLMMVFYHAFYTAGEIFGLAAFSELMRLTMPLEPIFAAAFIVLSGVSSRLSHSNLLRGVKLMGVALCVTLVTVLVMPWIGFAGNEIYFGILHMLSCTIILFAALRKPLAKIPPRIGILACLVLYVLTKYIDTGIFGLPYIDAMNVHLPDALYQSSWLFPLGFHDGSFFSADYFPLLPWMFLFFAGTFAGVRIAKGEVPAFAYRSHVRPLAFLGRHALLIYVFHQPVIFAVFWCISAMMR